MLGCVALERLLPGDLHLVALPLPHQDTSQTVLGRRVFRVERDGLPEVVEGLVQPARFRQEAAAVEVGPNIPGVHTDRPVVVVDRFVKPALEAQDFAQVIVSHGRSWSNRQIRVGFQR